MLYNYVHTSRDHQSRFSSNVLSRYTSQMMDEESLVLSQYLFDLSEEEFIIKEDGEMEAKISRVSLATSCQVTQGKRVSSEAIYLWTQPQQICNFLRPRGYEERRKPVDR